METTWKILDRWETTLTQEEYTDDEGNVIPARTTTTVYTKVEYDIDGTIVVVDVPHFMPRSEEYIILGIENRAVTERRKLEG